MVYVKFRIFFQKWATLIVMQAFHCIVSTLIYTDVNIKTLNACVYALSGGKRFAEMQLPEQQYIENLEI